MNDVILKSVVEITRHRDVDSLECSLVMTLLGLVRCKSVSIYKYMNDNDSDAIEESLRLDVDVDHKGEAEYIWSEWARLITSEGAIKQCLKSGELVQVELDKTSVSLFVPVILSEKTVCAVGLSGLVDAGKHRELICGLVKIYENYLLVLNESERDKLTNLFNRRTFDKKLQRLLAMQVKNRIHDRDCSAGEKRRVAPNSSSWLVILDIDHFKRVNDQFGHICGDEVILMLSQKMRQCFRSTDLLFRFGGEEFVVILEPISFEMANLILERFRKTVEEHIFPLVKTITISIGYSKISESDYPPEVLENADKALYFAKENGRNCVHSYESLVEMGQLEAAKTSGTVDLF